MNAREGDHWDVGRRRRRQSSETSVAFSHIYARRINALSHARSTCCFRFTYTLWGVHSVVKFCFLFFRKFLLPIVMHNRDSICPTARGTCQKCFTKHHDWAECDVSSNRFRWSISRYNNTLEMRWIRVSGIRPTHPILLYLRSMKWRTASAVRLLAGGWRAHSGSRLLKGVIRLRHD